LTCQSRSNCFKILVFKDKEVIKIGSGFILIGNSDTNAIALGITNEHVLEGGDKALIEFENERIFIDSVEHVSFKKDYAIIGINSKYSRKGLLSTIPISKSTKEFECPIVGENIFTISCPKGLINSVSSGIISSLRIEEGVFLIQFTAPVSPGSSGGVLFSEKGNLIGLISSQYSEGQNLNFALRVDEITNDFIELDDSKKISSCLLKELENKKIKLNPYLNEINKLIGSNMALAYAKMNENPKLVNQSLSLSFLKMGYEIENKFYTEFVSSFSLYHEQHGLDQILALNILAFQDELIKQKLTDSYVIEIVNQISEKFPKPSDVKPFLNLIEGTCKFKVRDYYSAVSNMNDFVTINDFNLDADTSFQASAYKLLQTYLYYGYQIMGFSYTNLGNYKLASDNLIKCLEFANEKEYGCEISNRLIMLLAKQGDNKAACKYFLKYKPICGSLFDSEFKKIFSEYCQ
jgi:tetratricopeptide (TPR) repeat protein